MQNLSREPKAIMIRPDKVNEASNYIAHNLHKRCVFSRVTSESICDP